MPQSAILNLSRQDNKTVESLITLLHGEREALEHRDASRLETLIDEKSVLISLINNNAKQRSDLLQGLGYENNSNGMQNYLSSLPPEDREPQKLAWQTLEQGLSSCQELNLINAKIVQRTQSAVGKLLTIYRGHDPKSVSLYGEDGSATQNSEHRSITKA